MLIGSPEYNIKTIFSLNSPHFGMLSNLGQIDEDKLSSYYDIKKSKSFQNITCLNQYYIQSIKDLEAKEKFKIDVYDIENKIIKKIIINDLDFVFGVKNVNIKNENLSEIYFLTIGLQIFIPERYIQEKKINFIPLLKQKNIIDTYNWFIYYEKIKKNKEELYNLEELINIKKVLIIGDFPHKYKSDQFHKEQLFSVYSNYLFWKLEFKSVYFYRNNTKFNTGMMKQEIYHNNARMNFNNFFIWAPSIYMIMIRNSFFIDYINWNICHYQDDDLLESFYCDKSENFSINNLKYFPILYLEHNELNYTFELNYKDLFIEKDNKYIFMIVRKKGEIDEWYLGHIFFSKYQFVFNQDLKSISFYNLDIEAKNEESTAKTIIVNNSTNFKYIFLIIILSSILFIVLGFMIGRYIYKEYKKKKRANELDDDYEYISDKNIN